MNEPLFSRRYRRTLMASLALGTLAMIGAVWWYYLSQRAAAEETAVHELSAIAAMQAGQIEQWRNAKLAIGDVVSVSRVMRIAREMLAGHDNSEASRAGVLYLFNVFGHEFEYASVALVDMQGTVRLGANVTREDAPQYKAFVRDAQSAGKVTLSDIYRDASGRVRMTLSLPVDKLGAIVLMIDPQKTLYSYLALWPSASRTGETALFRRDGDYLEYLSELRYQHGTTLNYRRYIPPSPEPSVKQLADGWVRKVRDYRGVPVLGVIRSIPGSNWYLSTKVDAEEIYAPLTQLSWELAAMVVLVAIANSAGVGFLWRNQQLRAHREHKALTGHFDLLTQYANDVILLADETGRIVEANQRAVEVYGYSQEELKLLTVKQLRAPIPGQPPAWPDRDVRFGSRYEAVLRRKDGSTFPAELSVRTLEVRGKTFCQAFVRDISERVRTEQEVKALSARLINAQEEERSRIARELHVDISQQLAALSAGMNKLRKSIPKERAELCDQGARIHHNMAQIAESIRRLSHQLHPSVLEDSGLGAALSGYCSEFTLLTHIRVSCKTRGSFGGIPQDVALCVYRVNQEALQNVAKHAGVPEVDVELIHAEQELCLTVSDRGAGMRLDGSGKPAGLGLVSIKERTRLVNGTFQIKSQPNCGTELSLKIPL